MEPEQEGLEEEPFADETVEKGQTRDGGRAHQEEERRPRHALHEATHLFDVASPCGHDHAPRAQEEESLEDRVVEHVVQARGEPHRGQSRPAPMFSTVW